MKVSKSFVFSTALLTLLGGCATVQETYAPDGRKAFTFNCSGLARGWDKCYTAAGQKCGASGYDILDRTGEDATVAGVGGNQTGFGGSFAKTQERSMLVACKK